jgi:DNA-binding transcriptional MerR regulator
VTTDSRLTFKEMCAKFQPEKEGRSRFYSPRDVARMVLILRGRRFGFSLEDIRQWLLIYEEKGTRAQMEAWIELSDGQLVALNEQRQQLTETIDELKRLRDDVAQSLT